MFHLSKRKGSPRCGYKVSGSTQTCVARTLLVRFISKEDPWLAQPSGRPSYAGLIAQVSFSAEDDIGSLKVDLSALLDCPEGALELRNPDATVVRDEMLLSECACEGGFSTLLLVCPLATFDRLRTSIRTEQGATPHFESPASPGGVVQSGTSLSPRWHPQPCLLQGGSCDESEAAVGKDTGSPGVLLRIARHAVAEQLGAVQVLVRKLRPRHVVPLVPVLLSLRSEGINNLLLRLCAQSDAIRHFTLFYLHSRPCFSSIAERLPPMLDTNGFVLLVLGTVFESGLSYPVTGLHPFSGLPVSSVRCDHVFHSLARPAILSFHSTKSPPEMTTTTTSWTSSWDSEEDSQSLSTLSAGPGSEFEFESEPQTDDVSIGSRSSSRAPPSCVGSPAPAGGPTSRDGEGPNGGEWQVAPRVLVKRGEDIFHESMIQVLFRLFNEIWTERLPAHMRPQVLCFAEIPVGKETGLLEIVEGCVSLEVVEKGHFEHVVNHEVFLSSSCGWILAAYLLGLSDRHRENTLVRTADSAAIPIDFGFMLGVECPSVNTYLVTVSQEMYRYLHGRKTWCLFCTMFLAGFYTLRRQADVIIRFAQQLFLDHRDTHFLGRFLSLRLLLEAESELVAIKKLSKMLAHAPLCVDTKLKLNLLELNKSVLKTFGDTYLLRMIVGSSLGKNRLHQGAGHLHFDRVELDLPSVIPSGLPHQLITLLRELESISAAGRCLPTFGGVPIPKRKSLHHTSISIDISPSSIPNDGQTLSEAHAHPPSHPTHRISASEPSS